MSEPKDQPALGFSFQVDLGGGRLGTVQSFVPNDCDKADLNTMLDKSIGAMDRLKARYEIQEWEAEIEKHEEALARAEHDVQGVELHLKRVIADLTEQGAEWARRRDALTEDARETHSSSGRRGEYQPAGQVKQAVKNYETEIDKVRGEIERQTAEADLGRKNFQTNMERFRKEISRLQGKIGKAKEAFGW